MQANRSMRAQKLQPRAVLYWCPPEAKREALIYARISGLKKIILSRFLVLPAGPSSPYSGERASRTAGSVTSFFHCNNHVTSNFHAARGIKA